MSCAAASGPLQTTFGRYRMELFDAFIAAGQQAGYPFNPDYNGAEQEGFVYTQYTHLHGFPMRCSAARGYLWPAMKRQNLTVWTGAFVQRLLLDGKTARKVEVVVKGERSEVTADREIILSAGAYQSPQILMLSGIGDPGQARGSTASTAATRLPGSARTCRIISVPMCSTAA